MSRPARSRFGAVLLLSAALSGAHAAAAPVAAGVAGATDDLPFLLDTVAGGALPDQGGHPRDAASFAGHLVLVHLVTTRCPSLCAVRTLALSAVARTLPEEVAARLRFVALSIDPTDGPEDLAAFAAGLRLDAPRWTLLATDAGQAARIRQAIGRQVRRAGDDAAEPASTVFLFDRRGRLMQSFGGRALDRARLAREIVDLDRFDAASSQTAAP